MKKPYYGWVITYIGAFVFALNSLSIYGFGVFLKPLTAEFDWERGAVSGAFSVGILIHGFLTLITGRLGDRYGPRILVTISGFSTGLAFFLMSQVNQLWQIYFFWGIFVGLGLSCNVVPIVSTIPLWFTKKRGMAMAIPGTGFSIGAIAAPMFIQSLISNYGWQQTFIIIGFIPAIAVPIAAYFLKKEPEQMGIKPYGEDDISEGSEKIDSRSLSVTFAQSLKTLRFWMFGAMHFCAGFYLQMVVVHVVPRAIDVGITEIAAAAVLSIVAGTGAFGRFFAGVLSDNFNSRKIMFSCLVAITLTLIILLFARQMWAFGIYATVFGLASGAFITLMPIVVSELFGLTNMGAIWGAIMLFGTIGGAIGAPLSGFIFDLTDTYSVSFIVGIVIAAIATFLGLGLLRSVKK